MNFVGAFILKICEDEEESFYFLLGLFKNTDYKNIFKNDLDKGGHPYILHLLYVYSNVHNEKEKVIALLHDIIEDKDVSDTDLLEVGYPEDIVMSVKLLSKSHGADYNKYIDNIINNGNVDTLNVKLADLKHNMDISRIKDPTISDYERI